MCGSVRRCALRSGSLAVWGLGDFSPVPHPRRASRSRLGRRERHPCPALRAKIGPFGEAVEAGRCRCVAIRGEPVGDGRLDAEERHGRNDGDIL